MSERFIVDNSVVMAWCFKDQSDVYTDWVLDSLSTFSARAPAIWPLEVVNVLLAAERRNRLAEADSIRFISLLNRLPIRVEPQLPVEELMGGLPPVARKYGLSSYNASYLHLAMRNGLALATCDGKLKAAAKKAKVALWTQK